MHILQINEKLFQITKCLDTKNKRMLFYETINYMDFNREYVRPWM